MGRSVGRAPATTGAVRSVAVVVALAVALGAVSARGVAAEPSPPARTNTAPVLLLHGYLLNSCPGTNANSTFASLITKLKAKGYTGRPVPIDYYACDSKGTNIQGYGDPNAYYPGGYYTASTGGSYKGGNTNNTDLRHIAYQLAWYVYSAHSSKGQSVSIVGYSMGGLIARWMLYGVQSRDPAFPPYLYVQDMVTISTPHRGTDDGFKNVGWCPPSTQCKQMFPGSPFLTELAASGLHPQATGGTDWTVLGDSPCDAIGKNPAGTTMDAGSVHKVSYYAPRASTPNCYNHTSYLTDTSDQVDMPVRTSEPWNPTWVTGKGQHSLARVISALTSGTA